MIAIDIGCARHGNSYSIERLIEELHPDELYGFDPFPGRTDYWMPKEWEGTKVYLDHKAAWTHDGEVGFLEDGIESRISEVEDHKVSCFDLADFIRDLIGPIFRDTFFTNAGVKSYGPPMREAPLGEGVEGTFMELEGGHVGLEMIPEIVLKIDAEGAEYPLLMHLIGQGADQLLKLAWIEWHDVEAHSFAKRYIEENIQCELVDWPW